MEEEKIENQRQLEENYLAECGACPNCGMGCHMSDLGNESDGQICCINCYESYRGNLLSKKK